MVSAVSSTTAQPRHCDGRIASTVFCKNRTAGPVAGCSKTRDVLARSGGLQSASIGRSGFPGGYSCGITHSMTEAVSIFNRNTVRLHRERALSYPSDSDFLLREVANRLVDRLEDVTSHFETAVELGCRSGILGELLQNYSRVDSLFCCDYSSNITNAARSNPGCRATAFSVADEEALPFGDGKLDLVVSNLSLHWVNDLPGSFAQIKRALRPDGLFLATLFGGETLHELRSVLSDAEIAVEGGLSPRVSPFTDIRDAGGLLQRAGFALPVVDTETITVFYEEPFRLLRDLRGMGETNAVQERRKTFSRRETLMTALNLYRERFAGSDGRIPATFTILYLSGWAPAPGQQQPLKPGQGKVSLRDFLGDPVANLETGTTDN